MRQCSKQLSADPPEPKVQLCAACLPACSRVQLGSELFQQKLGKQCLMWMQVCAAPEGLVGGIVLLLLLSTLPLHRCTLLPLSVPCVCTDPRGLVMVQVAL